MCAGYALYGSATMVVLSLGKESGVNGFMLDPVSLYLLTRFHLIKKLRHYFGSCALRYQHCTVLCSVDNGVPQLSQTLPHFFN